jgi:hypothetical protein
MAAPPPNNTRANSLAEQRFQGYDYLDALTNNVKPNSGTFFMTDPRTGGVNPALQARLNAQKELAKTNVPKTGEQRYGFVNFGQGMDSKKNNRSWQEKFSVTPGAGLWALGINPDDPQAEAKAQAMLGRLLNSKDPKYRQGVWGDATWGRDDAKVPSIRQLMAQNPNIPATELLDYSQRALQAQNALQPRDIGGMILDTFAQIALTALSGGNPTLAIMYGAAKGGSDSGSLLGAGLGALSGASTGLSTGAVMKGITAAGGLSNYAGNLLTKTGNFLSNPLTSTGNYVSGLANDATNFFKYGPELGSAEFASYFPGGAGESILNNINTTALFPNASWVAEGAQAGLSNAAKAAGAIGTANTLSKGAGALGTQAGAKGGDVSWVSDALNFGKETLSTIKSDFGITGGDILRGGASLVSGAMSADAAREAARMQANAATAGGQLASQTADKQMALLEKMFNKQIELQEPFRQGGVAAENRMLDLLGLSSNRNAAGYGSLGKNFGMSDFQADPGYAFRMSEGLKAVDRQAAARGGLISGGALKASQRYGQDLASQEYQNAYNRYQTNRTNLLNPLQSLAGAGQTSANTMGNAAAGYGSEGSNALGGAGTAQANAIQNAANARASGYLGAQQSWNQAIQNVAAIPGQSQQNAMMNAMMNRYLNS